MLMSTGLCKYYYLKKGKYTLPKSFTKKLKKQLANTIKVCYNNLVPLIGKVSFPEIRINADIVYR